MASGSGSGTKRRGRGAAAPEFVSLDGLRIDGRRSSEVRKIRCALGALTRADGSAYYEQGNTRVLAAVYGPRDPGTQSSSDDVGVDVRCEFSTALFATASRARGWKGDRRSQAAARVLSRAYRSVIVPKHARASRIDVYVQVLQDDGAVLSAAINAGSLALVNAGVPMIDLVVACSVGYVDNSYVLDVCTLEAAGNDRPQLVVASLAHAKTVISVELDAKLPSVKILDSAMNHAIAGCHQVFQVLEHEIRQYSLNLLDSRGLVAF